MKKEFDSIGITKDTPESYIKKLGADCDQCDHCCKYGSGYFNDEDIKRISSHMGMKKEHFIEEFLEEKEAFNKKMYRAKLNRDNGKEYGSCVFLDDKDGGCVVHDIKPYHCSIGKGCGEYGEQITHWFMLNHIVDDKDPESIRQWAQFLETNGTIPGGQLEELIQDKKLLKEILEYKKLK